MPIKTKSGICINVQVSPSIVLNFDKPVRTIELTKNESLRVAFLLTENPSTANLKKHLPNTFLARSSRR